MSEKPRHLHWKRPRPPRSASRRPGKLTPEEEACTRGALKFLAVRHGGWKKLAARMGVNVYTLMSACLKKRRAVDPGIALEVARAAGVTIDDVLSGAWPAREACPTCGQMVHAGISGRKA